jgi:UDP-glucose 4-epimerase
MSAISEIRKPLVTGSSGTIGTSLCERFLESGMDFVGVDLKHNKWNSKVDKLTIKCDLTKRQSLERIPSDVDMVIHLAANARVYDLVQSPSMARDNIEMLFNILEFCRKNKINRFIFASSREVYGNDINALHKEDDVCVMMCESPYSASKIGGEALVHSYQQCYGIDFIILRFSNVYGRYDLTDRVIPEFIKRTKNNKELIVYGREKILDFTYIDDCVNGIMKALKNFGDARNHTFNLCSGKGTTLLEVAKTIRSLMNGNNNITIKESRTGEVTKFIGDISRARKMLGYSPETEFKEGIRKTIEWYINRISRDD